MTDFAQSARDTNYYVMKFQRKVEAAALLAALSRFLNSPEGRVGKSEADLVEIRGRSTAPDEAELYISGSALKAISAAFSPLPELTACSAEAIPSDAAVLLTRQTPAWGLDEARNRLA